MIWILTNCTNDLEKRCSPINTGNKTFNFFSQLNTNSWGLAWAPFGRGVAFACFHFPPKETCIEKLHLMTTASPQTADLARGSEKCLNTLYKVLTHGIICTCAVYLLVASAAEQELRQDGIRSVDLGNEPYTFQCSIQDVPVFDSLCRLRIEVVRRF